MTSTLVPIHIFGVCLDVTTKSKLTLLPKPLLFWCQLLPTEKFPSSKGFIIWNHRQDFVCDLKCVFPTIRRLVGTHFHFSWFVSWGLTYMFIHNCQSHAPHDRQTRWHRVRQSFFRFFSFDRVVPTSSFKKAPPPTRQSNSVRMTEDKFSRSCSVFFFQRLCLHYKPCVCCWCVDITWAVVLSTLSFHTNILWST